MQEMLADPKHEYRAPQFGDVIDGIIMRLDRDEMLVDIGAKSEGVIPAREFSSLSDDERDQLSVGDTVLVFVTQPENADGVVGLSIDRARQEKSWRTLQTQYEGGELLNAEVVNYNKGGLLVNLDGVRGFVPASQVTEITTGDEAQKQAEMARLVGRSLQLKIIEINRNRNRLILSERQALQERRDEMKEKLIEELTEGEVRRGRVSSICDFGAFVDVGGADGLVHLSELSWSRVRHPSEVLHVGDEIDVFVLGINAEERKIALSIKRTQPEPWQAVATKYDVNQLVLGTVTQLANFGAFARIEDGIEGLVHVSELSEARVAHPRQLVHEGQELLLRIIRIDPQRRRMGLSLRRALEATDEEVELALSPEAVALKHELLALELQADPSEEQADEFDEVEGAAPVAEALRDAVEAAEDADSETVQAVTDAVEAADASVAAETSAAAEDAEPEAEQIVSEAVETVEEAEEATEVVEAAADEVADAAPVVTDVDEAAEETEAAVEASVADEVAAESEAVETIADANGARESAPEPAAAPDEVKEPAD
jgi:small subunit ribosomal protein S1